MASIQPLQLTIRSSIFDRNRPITIAADFIEFDDNDQRGMGFTRFSKEEIRSFRYGIRWVRGRYLMIGRIYCIDVRSEDNRIIKIRLHSAYGVRRKLLGKKYVQLVNALYRNFFDDISREYLVMFDNNIDFELGGLIFSQAGLAFDSKSDFVPWEFIGTSAYTSYYAIYPESDPNSYKAFTYIHDWNAGIVYSVSRQILAKKGLYKR